MLWLCCHASVHWQKCKRKENWQMNRKYYFNNMWWGWVTGDICCICHGIMILNTDYCSGVFLSAEWFCIRLQNGILKIQLWNLPGLISGTAVFLLIHLENGIACCLYGYCFHIISSVKYDIYSFCYYKKAVCKIDSLSYILFKYPRTYATRII